MLERRAKRRRKQKRFRFLDVEAEVDDEDEEEDEDNDYGDGRLIFIDHKDRCSYCIQSLNSLMRRLRMLELGMIINIADLIVSLDVTKRRMCMILYRD